MGTFNSAQQFFYDIKATITTTGGTEYSLTADDILNYEIQGNAGEGCIPLGMTASQSFVLEYDNSELGLKATALDSARVQVWVSKLTAPGDPVWQAFGYWYVSDVQSSEQSQFCTISGEDALATRFEPLFTDAAANYPQTIGDLLDTICLLAGVTCSSHTDINYNVEISTMPKWENGTTLRNVLEYIATLNAACAYISYDGYLVLRPVGNISTYHSVNSNYYTDFSEKGGSAFDFNCIQWVVRNASASASEPETIIRFAIDDTKEDNATNTVQIRENPLATNATITAVKNALAGWIDGEVFEGITLSWFGDPSVSIGDVIQVQTLDGESHLAILTGHNTHFSAGGMNSESMSDMPVLTTQQSSGYSGTVSVLNPDGTVSVEAVSGLNQRILSTEYAFLSSLTAQDLTVSGSLGAAIASVIQLFISNTTITGPINTSGNITTTGKITAATASLGKAPPEVINQSFWQDVYIAKLIRGLYMDLCVGSWSGSTDNKEKNIVFADTGGHVMSGTPLVFIMQNSGVATGFKITNRSTTGFTVKSGEFDFGFEYLAIYFGFNTNGV